MLTDNLKTLAFNVIYRLIMIDYRADYMHTEKKFSGNSFAKLTKNKVNDPNLLLNALLEEDYIKKTYYRGGTVRCWTITEKFAGECKKLTGRRISAPKQIVNISAKSRNKFSLYLQEKIEKLEENNLDNFVDQDMLEALRIAKELEESESPSKPPELTKKNHEKLKGLDRDIEEKQEDSDENVIVL